MANWNWNQEPGAKSWELGSWHAQYTSANINLFMSMCPLLAPHISQGRRRVLPPKLTNCLRVNFNYSSLF